MRGVAEFDHYAEEPERIRSDKRRSPLKLLAAFADWFDQHGTYVPTEVAEPLATKSSMILFITWWITFCAFILVIAVAFH